MGCESPCFDADWLISSLRAKEIDYREQALIYAKLPGDINKYYQAKAKAEACEEVLKMCHDYLAEEPEQSLWEKFVNVFR